MKTKRMLKNKKTKYWLAFSSQLENEIRCKQAANNIWGIFLQTPLNLISMQNHLSNHKKILDNTTEILGTTFSAISIRND